jgi:uncharacterized protein YrrD
MLFSDVDRRPIMAQGTAREVGRVLRCSIDPARGRIVAIHAVHLPLARVAAALHLPSADGKLPQLLVEWGSVIGFGPDAVIVADDAALRAPRSAEERRLVRGDFDLERKLALSDRGERLAAVRDIAFDPGTGQVARIVLDDGTSPPARFLAISPYAVVVGGTPAPVERVFRARDLFGRPVVTLDTASDIAEVRDVIVDTASGTLQGFTLKGRGFLARPHKGLLPAANVAAVGGDAIMIATADAIVAEERSPASLLQRHELVIGVRVLTEAGQLLGTVAAALLQEVGDRVAIVGYELRRADGAVVCMPTPRDYRASGEAFIVPAEIESHLAADLVGFGATLRRYRTARSPERAAQPSA